MAEHHSSVVGRQGRAIAAAKPDAAAPPAACRIELERLEDRVTPTLVPLASFDGTNGAYPYAGLVMDSSGDFFGTTSSGGTYNEGTVFELSPGAAATP